MNRGRFLAFDLGAESGRALVGRLDAGTLALDELARFPNEPVRTGQALQWDILRLWREMQCALDGLPAGEVTSVGVDTWGCDFALIGEHGGLLENPYHYRDRRTDGMLEPLCDLVGRERIYASTGSQFLPINTLVQLYAACQATPRLVGIAHALLTIPDLLNYWLTGRMRTEYTIASTTQMADPRTRGWATSLVDDLGLPSRLLQPIVEPGTVLGPIRAETSASLAGVPVVAPACHDTGSAFAAACSARCAVLSSGTWSLLGAEIPAPVVTPEARALNFTNEGGVCGTTRLLKNIGGLWLLQSSVRTWTAAGLPATYDALVAAADEADGFLSLFDPDHEALFHPRDMPTAIADLCRRTGQPAPATPAACTRAILESLAFKYAGVLDSLESLTGTRYDAVRIVGGGARNRLLNQFTANATGRPVLAGPVEATALGNVVMQMLATGAVGSLDEAREIVLQSFPVERFEPRDVERWQKEYQRFRTYVEVVNG